MSFVSFHGVLSFSFFDIPVQCVGDLLLSLGLNSSLSAVHQQHSGVFPKFLKDREDSLNHNLYLLCHENETYICHYHISITSNTHLQQAFTHRGPPDIGLCEKLRDATVFQTVINEWVHCGGGNSRPNAAPGWGGGKKGKGPTVMHGWQVKHPTKVFTDCFLLTSFFRITVLCCFCVCSIVLHCGEEWTEERGMEKKDRIKKDEKINNFVTFRKLKKSWSVLLVPPIA